MQRLPIEATASSLMRGHGCWAGTPTPGVAPRQHRLFRGTRSMPHRCPAPGTGSRLLPWSRWLARHSCAPSLPPQSHQFQELGSPFLPAAVGIRGRGPLNARSFDPWWRALSRLLAGLGTGMIWGWGASPARCPNQ